MKVAVFGTGIVGQVIANRLVGLGHTVTIGTRDVSKTLVRAEKDVYGILLLGNGENKTNQLILAPSQKLRQQQKLFSTVPLVKAQWMH